MSKNQSVCIDGLFEKFMATEAQHLKGLLDKDGPADATKADGKINLEFRSYCFVSIKIVGWKRRCGECMSKAHALRNFPNSQKQN
ncbi:hypothetical protein DENIS_1223 [Desulfonema ishimotonii]|uniref:Uncharacterized protein n=1 Tax=Desulfonema ishimotonii TaxID=45657 RepID=A0A401FTH3_9BACT|nr:hypothetical protein [Desulfonema ishimotonii]GBC60272.1 hypothetical protein DENIS_1223 [Desulfonema ishimotonii]